MLDEYSMKTMNKIIPILYCFIFLFNQNLFAKFEMRIFLVSTPQTITWTSGHTPHVTMFMGDSLEMKAVFRDEGYDEPMDSVHWFLNGMLAGTTQGTKTFKFNAPGVITAIGIPYPGWTWMTAKDSVYLTIVPFTQPLNLNLKLFFEGYYLGNGLMLPVINPNGQPNTCDSITVELHNSTETDNKEFEKKGVISTTGNGTFILPPETYGKAYYIVIKHKNSIETWSKIPILFNTQNISIDFTIP